MPGVKMQTVFLIINIFIMILFFSIKRINNFVHKVYSALLTVAMINLIFDIVTNYTVNHIDSIPVALNRAVHEIFIASILAFIYLLSIYIAILCDEKFIRTKKGIIIWSIPFLISFLLSIVLPLYYVENDVANYSFGPAAFSIYGCMFIYVVASFVIFLKDWRQTEGRKRNIIFMALDIFVVVSVIQAVYPTLLISSVGVFFNILAIYLTLENPDRVLMEKYHEEKNRADEANKAKSAFLANMSHEIRTPINAVIGLNEMILREYDDPQLVDYSESIDTAARTLLSLINDILDFSKIEAGKMELIEGDYDLAITLNDLVTMISYKTEAKGLKLITQVDETTPHMLHGDEVRVKQVITNILSNAAKYTEKGSVTLKTEWERTEKDRINLVISIIDTGVGIKEEDMPKLFASFERIEGQKNHSIEGTGLGMTITTQLLSLMHGELKVESEYGKGSCFKLIIPQVINSEEPIGDFKNTRKKLINKRKKYVELFTAPYAKVLIVDDNMINLKVASCLLKRTLVQVDTASSGIECLSMVQNTPYDVIFLDHMMPDMDGVETLNHIRKDKNLCQNTPVIILTANAISGAREEYIKKGFTDYLSKPIDGHILEQMLVEYLPEDLVKITSE